MYVSYVHCVCGVFVISLKKIEISGNSWTDFYLVTGGYRNCSVWLLTESREKFRHD